MTGLTLKLDSSFRTVPGQVYPCDNLLILFFRELFIWDHHFPFFLGCYTTQPQVTVINLWTSSTLFQICTHSYFDTFNLCFRRLRGQQSAFYFAQEYDQSIFFLNPFCKHPLTSEHFLCWDCRNQARGSFFLILATDLHQWFGKLSARAHLCPLNLSTDKTQVLGHPVYP